VSGEYVARNVTVIDFSNPRSIQLPEVYQPQSCIVQLEHGSIDIGSHCYAVRKLNKKGVSINTRINSQGLGVIEVVLGSLDEGRIPLIRKLIEYAAYCTKSVSQATLPIRLRSLLPFLQFYFGQSDLDYFDPEKRHHYEEAVRRYSAVVQADRAKQVSSKHQLTSSAFKFAQFLYDAVDLNAFDYDIIPSSDQNKGGTTPLLPEEHELALALRAAIFEGVVDLLVNNRALPYRLKVPAACAELNDTIWLGYKPWGGPSCFPRAKDFEKRQPKEWFDRDKGALVTKDQWMRRTDHSSRASGHNSFRGIQRGLKVSNTDHSSLKTTLAEFAGQCFLDLLLSMTGMNQQSALDLPWYGGYFVQKGKQGNKTVRFVKHEDQFKLEQEGDPNIYLRSIKNRKGYQPVEVTISNRFLPLFERYLKLRDYYLNARVDARLFPLAATLVYHKRYSLQAAFPEIPRLGAHKARAGVSDSILTTTNDPHVAAGILQNDPKTVIKHYAAGTQKAHIEGVGGFFNAFGNQIKVTRLAAKNKIETAVGSCDNGGATPESLPDAPIEANCTQQEGCFFCKHYCVHADEIDIRKLVSVLYFINAGATRAHDVNLFNELFQLVIARIKDLLEQIEAISVQKKALVARIKEEVFVEEALDEYWLGKLNRLETLAGKR
tara:strand:+ start:1591 stop:3570 length:1980 start_codon:yes stop_codon:yes gene_type:complete